MNFRIKRLYVIFVGLASFLSLDAYSQELDGFKTIKFGAVRAELEKIGVRCSSLNTGPCYLEDTAPRFTFLNQPVLNSETYDFQVWLSNDPPNGVDQIAFYVNLNASSVSTSLTKQLGKPLRLWDRDYWFFENDAAIVAYNPESDYHPARLFYFAANNPELMEVYSRLFPNKIISSDY